MKHEQFFRFVRAVAAATTAACGVPTAHAQCDQWRAGPFTSVQAAPGINDPSTFGVEAMTTWDPGDGTGPQLVVGGQFTSAGGATVNHITRWDGYRWQPLGTGMNGDVEALTSWDPDGPGPLPPVLVAAGNFTTAGGTPANRIAYWDGSAWHAMGAGFNSIVYALASFDPTGSGTAQLIAGGVFVNSGATTVNRIARWNGASWDQVGPGMGGSVYALCAWDPDGPGGAPTELAVGGLFTATGDNTPMNYIARWNGSTFSAYGAGVNNSVRAFTAWDPDGSGPSPNVLVVAGDFASAGANIVHGIARWDGSTWQGFGTGLHSNTVYSGTALATLGLGGNPSDLYIAGAFDSVNGVPASNIARWNGSNWVALAAGTNNIPYALTVWDPDGDGPLGPSVIAGGAFTTADGQAVNHIAKYNGSSWSPFLDGASGLTGTVNALTNFNGSLVAGGTFDALATATDDHAANIASWNGEDTFKFTTGTNGTVRAFKAYSVGFNQFLVVGGDFTSAGNVSGTNRIAYYESSVLVQGNGWFAMGTGFNGTVYAIERYNSAVYAAGSFTAGSSGTPSLNKVARFVSGAWQAAGGGLPGGDCYALKLYGGNLYAAGTFGTLYRFDGTNWLSIGGSGYVNGTVRALEVYNNELIIGGNFNSLAGAPNLIKYNGTSFTTLGGVGPGPLSTTTVWSLATDGTSLYIGGDFTNVGGLPAARVARWDGTTWYSARGGADSTVLALRAYHGEMHAGGQFSNVGSPSISSPGEAIYEETGAPWVSGNPSSAGPICVGGSAAFSVQAADGFSGLSYSWRLNGVPLANGTLSDGCVIARADTADLSLSNASYNEDGTYDCVVSNSCGSGTSFGATLTVCPADYNCDGFANGDDFDAFSADFDAGNQAADVNRDGFVNGDDFDFFSQHFDAGC